MHRAKILSTYLVVPAFNESRRIGSGDYFKTLAEQVPVNFYFVNDGSTDETLFVLNKLLMSMEGELLNLPLNKGKAEAIRQGMIQVCHQANPDYIGFLDSDAAFPLESVESFIDSAISKFESEPSIEVVISSRVKLSGRNIRRNISRHYISRVIITFIGFFITDLPYDSQSGLKLFRNNATLRNALAEPFVTKWFFDIELLIRMKSIARSCVWEEPVDSWRDVAGSHLNWRKFPGLAREILKVIKLGRLTNRKKIWNR